MNGKPVDGLPLVTQHVAGGKARCARQIVLIARLREDGRDTGMAETLLIEFEQTLAHLQRLRAIRPS